MRVLVICWEKFCLSCLAVNANDCLLTRMQEMSMDYHFKVEQEAGSSLCNFFGYNGMILARLCHCNCSLLSFSSTSFSEALRILYAHERIQELLECGEGKWLMNPVVGRTELRQKIWIWHWEQDCWAGNLSMLVALRYFYLTSAVQFYHDDMAIHEQKH